MAGTLSDQQVALQVAERLREIATRQGTVPFKTGDLRKAHVVEPQGKGAALRANTPYARAVHDGRPARTIRAKKKKALYWKGAAHPVKAVNQPATRGRPWIEDSIQTLQREGLGFLAPAIGADAVKRLERELAKSKLLTVKKR